MQSPKIRIITGDKQSGKTTSLFKLIDDLQSKRVKVCGILSEGTFNVNKRDAFYAIDIESRKRIKLMSDKLENKNQKKIGKFYYSPSSFDWGTNLIIEALNNNCQYIVLDEVGKLEIKDKGWHNAIEKMIVSGKNLVFVVRKEFVDIFIEKYQIASPKIIDLSMQ